MENELDDTLYLFTYNKYLDIVPKLFDNTNSICAQFYDYKFWHTGWDTLNLSSLSPKIKTFKFRL